MWRILEIALVVAFQILCCSLPNSVAATRDSMVHNDGVGTSNNNNTAFTMMVTSGFFTIAFASALAYVLLGSNGRRHDDGVKKSGSQNGIVETQKVPTEEEVIDEKQYPGGSLTIYYGTQTGTSESFARVLERDGTDQGFLVHVVDLDNVSSVKDIATRSIFLIATYGEGEPPDNAVSFVQSIKEYLPSLELLIEKSTLSDEDIINTRTVVFTNDKNNSNTELQKLDYCVFGLGNKQYDNFNAMGKYFDKALGMLGGNRIISLGLGDDDDDLENDFDTWKDSVFWPTITKLYLPIDIKSNGIKDKMVEKKKALELPDCRYEIVYHTDDSVPFIGSSSTATDVSNLIKGYDEHYVHSSSRHYFTSIDCPVSVVRELRTPEDTASTVHIEIDITKSNIDYITADNLAVLPMNGSTVVESVAASLNLPSIDTTVFSLKGAAKHEWHGIPFPMPITIRECLTRYCDLTGPLRRSDLKLLASYATDPIDQKALLRMSSKDGKEEYKEKITSAFVGIADLLQLCPSITMPFEHFLNICPVMQFRFYTISSSNLVHPKSIHITVSVTENVRPSDGKILKGLCSSYLASLRPGIDIVRMFVRPSTFRLPADATKPILMIGPGTGVAPMRAFTQERAYQKEQQNLPVGRSILYFGCKHPSKDYIYQNEIEKYQQDGILNDVHVAFSRLDPTKKVYVQYLLQQHDVEIWNLIHNENGSIYVCGGVKMGQDVNETIQSIISQHAPDNTNAKEYLSAMSRDHRYIQELWA